MPFVPVFRSHAPGRINLIGEHTDYQGGFVFPAAINLGIEALAAPASVTTVISGDLKSTFDANTVTAPEVEPWARYVAGMAIELRAWGPLPNLEIHLTSNLPMGAGLSSSAALEMAIGALWRLAAGFDFSNAELALAGQRAENRHVGMACGIMDQTASALGVAGHALAIDTLEPGSPLAVPLPSDLALVACDTLVKHTHASSGYNDRRAQVESAARKLGVSLLRHVEHLDESVLDPVEAARARHVVGENLRVGLFQEALLAGDKAAMGALMRASHISLRDDFQVSCPELDAMAEAAWERRECVGARMTGGGFGGACVALVERDQVQDFVAVVAEGYTARTGRTGSFLIVEAADGVFAETLTALERGSV